MKIIKPKHLAVILFVIPVHCYSTEWIDCKNDAIWVGLLISFDDYHVIDFNVHKNGNMVTDTRFPFTQVDTGQRKAIMNGTSNTLGSVILAISGSNAQLKIKDHIHELSCDWSAF